MSGIRIQYVRIQFKKLITIFRRLLGRLFLVLLAGALGISFLYLRLQQPETEPPIKVALVLPGDQEDIRDISKILLALDSIRNTMSFVYPESDEVEEMLAAGEIQAAILFGEDFYEDVNGGTNTPVTILLPKGASQGVKLFAEIINAGIYLIDVTEAASYAMIDAWHEHGSSRKLMDMADEILDTYVAESFSRREDVEVQILSPTGEYALAEYYAAIGLMFFLLVCGMGFWGLYDDRDPLVEKKLALYGVGPGFQLVCKLAFLTLGFWLEAFLGVLALSYLGAKTGSFQIFITGHLALELIPLALSFSCAYHCFLSLGSRGSERRRILFLAVFSLLVLGGCLVPLPYLPQWVRQTAEWTPFYSFFSFLQEVLFGGGKLTGRMMFWSVLFFGCGTLYGCFGGYGDTSGQIADGVRSVRRAMFCGTWKSRLVQAKLFLKWLWKRRSPVVESLLLICVLGLLGSIHFSGQEDLILVSGGSGGLPKGAKSLIEQSMFTWSYEEDEARARDAVLSGDALASVLADGEKLTVCATALTPEVMVARETLVVAFFSEEHKELLHEICDKTFDAQETIYVEVLDTYESYMKSEKLFCVVYQTE